jgi:predicted TPR repeat methyltransferase
MARDYRQSHLENGKGNSYDATFKNEPYRRMVWQLEQSKLDSLIRKYFKGQKINYLDFACGTGRILSYLSDRVSLAVGVDISSAMLEVARKNNSSAEIIEADITNNDVLGERKFDLITAFRFFPNAQPELRSEVMEVLTRHLSANGYIVFNNHMNSGSSLNRLLGLLGREKFEGMSLKEVQKLLDNSNLKLVKKYHLCIIPASERRTFLPVFLLRPMEIILSKIGLFQNLGQNLIFVCTHKC